MSDAALLEALRPLRQGHWVETPLTLTWVEPDAGGGVSQRTVSGAGGFLRAAAGDAVSLRGWLTPLQAMQVGAAVLAAVTVTPEAADAPPPYLEVRTASQTWRGTAESEALTAVGRLFRRLENQLTAQPILQCAACDQTYSLFEALDLCELAVPTRGWVSFACPRCGQTWTLALGAQTAAYGQVNTAGEFTPRLTFPLVGLEVDALPTALRVRLPGDAAWEIAAAATA